MYLARVVGNVVTTARVPALDGKKLMVLQVLDKNQKPTGKVTLAADSVGCGFGEKVMVIKEGGGAAIVLGGKTPLAEVIVGIVDRFEIEE